MRIRLFALILALLLVLPGCAARSGAGGVAATTAPVAAFAEALLSGTDIPVTRLITDSVSCLHDYSLSVRQMEAAAQCDVLAISGAGLEDFMDDVIAQAPQVIDCAQGVALLGDDPHIWLDPSRAAAMAANLAAGLSDVYPDQAGAIADNLTDLTQKLTDLRATGEAALADLSTRELITFHDGFAYLADAFDLTILAAI